MSTMGDFERRSAEPRRPFLRARDGGIATMTALSAAFMVGAVALAVDLGAAYNLSTSLDNAADAYAIAGATQLDGTSGSCVRAIRAAAATSNAVANAGELRNDETFATNTSGTVTIDSLEGLGNANIQFLSEIVKDADGNVIGTYIVSDLVVGGGKPLAQFVVVQNHDVQSPIPGGIDLVEGADAGIDGDEYPGARLDCGTDPHVTQSVTVGAAGNEGDDLSLDRSQALQVSRVHPFKRLDGLLLRRLTGLRFHSRDAILPALLRRVLRDRPFRDAVPVGYALIAPVQSKRQIIVERVGRNPPAHGAIPFFFALQDHMP